LKGNAVSRQQRRARLKQSADAVSRHGINLDDSGYDQLWSMIGLTRILMDILGGRSPTRAGDAAKRAHEFFETSLKRNPSNHRIECAKGCAFCCHLRVTAMAPEVFHVANFVRGQFGGELETVLARVRAADAHSRGLSAAERPKHKFSCALLVDKACSIYAARPSACRGLTSISVKTCERGYNGEAVEVLTPAVWTEIRRAHNQPMWAALSAANLPPDSYELNHAVLVALTTPDAESRWLKGEEIFAGVSCDSLSAGPDAENRKKVVELLIAGALGKEFPAAD
jgi:hypothetical protein